MSRYINSDNVHLYNDVKFYHNRSFKCKCTYPRFAPTKVDPFTGEYCQYHNELNHQCVDPQSQLGNPERRICKNSADCRLVL